MSFDLYPYNHIDMGNSTFDQISLLIFSWKHALFVHYLSVKPATPMLPIIVTLEVTIPAAPPALRPSESSLLLPDLAKRANMYSNYRKEVIFVSVT